MTDHDVTAHRRARVARDHRLRRVLERRCVHGPEPRPRAPRPPTTEASGGAAPSAAAVTGTINVSGSSTVEPISTAVAELVKAANAGFNFTVTGPGTGDGFKTFCKGETDISDASRKIKDEEAAACKAAGIEYTELKIAYDGMTVMTSPDNSGRDLPVVRRPVRARPARSRRASTSGRRAATLAKSLGSNTVFPDADLSITGPGEESGTYDSYVELVITPIASKQTPPARVRHPARLRRERQRQRDHRRRRGLAELARLGRLRLRPGEQGQGQGARRRQGPERHLRRSRPTRRSPTAPTRSRGASTSTSTRPRPRRTRPSPATSTTTSPRARSRRSSRPSRT